MPRRSALPPGPGLQPEAPAAAGNPVAGLVPGEVVFRDGRLLRLQRRNHKGRGRRRREGIVLLSVLQLVSGERETKRRGKNQFENSYLLY